MKRVDVVVSDSAKVARLKDACLLYVIGPVQLGPELHTAFVTVEIFVVSLVKMRRDRWGVLLERGHLHNGERPGRGVACGCEPTSIVQSAYWLTGVLRQNIGAELVRSSIHEKAWRID